MKASDTARWLVLLHHLPPKPPYLRAKILRRLGQVGALPIKRSAYALPATAACMEDFQWILREIQEGGGEGWILRASLCAGLSDGELIEAFRTLRNADYQELAERARKLLEAITPSGLAPPPAGLRADWARTRTRLAALRRIDFFDASGREEVETVMDAIQKRGTPAASTSTSERTGPPRGRVWVTREGIEEDRIASAWLVRRFIDADASFKFVDPQRHTPGENEVAFDMYQGQFTHQEGRCTFEVLVEHFSLEDEALRVIGEIIHEIDLKDERFGRPETPGIELAIEGVLARNGDDEARLRDGSVLLDAIYERVAAKTFKPRFHDRRD